MTFAEIQARVQGLQTSLVERLGKQLYIGVDLGIHDSRVSLSWYGVDVDDSHYFRGECPEEIFSEAEEFIDSLPTAEEQEMIDFRSKLTKLIDTAPAKVDTAPLKKFQEYFYEGLLT